MTCIFNFQEIYKSIYIIHVLIHLYSKLEVIAFFNECTVCHGKYQRDDSYSYHSSVCSIVATNIVITTFDT